MSVMNKMKVFVIIFFFACECQCNTKIWQQRVTLGQADLWEGGRLPCEGQPIILPQEVVSIPGNFSLGSKVFLPENGMILFPLKGTVEMNIFLSFLTVAFQISCVC